MSLNVKKNLLKAKSLVKRGDLAAARDIYERILAHFPGNAEARRGLDAVERGPAGQRKPLSEAQVRHVISLYTAGQLTRAQAQAEPLVADHPDDPLLQNLLGAIRADLGMLDAACENLERAVRLKPDYVEAHNNLAAAYARLHRHQEAAGAYEAVRRLQPNSSVARINLYFERLKCADWRHVWPEVDHYKNAGVDGQELSPFKMLALDDDPMRNRQRAENYARRLYSQNELPLISPPDQRPAKLKIGYFSADFHDHATMYLMVKLFELHDANAFEIFAYSFGPPSDGAMRRRLADVTRLRDVRDCTDRQVAELAREDGIHIAVDLKGFTENARTGIFAYRAAPVQISYLGYPGTLGAMFMDYIIADTVVIPDTELDSYSEKVIRLPHSYQVNDDSRAIARETPSRESLGLPADGFVYCCFNNTYKISPREFTIWMRLLNTTEGSVLWLLKSNEVSQANLQREAKNHGVAPERLIFADRAPLPEHLARQRQADLFLDTFNYNAHTTASDALWAGLPVLTLKGKGFPARVAASLLSAVGVTETICETEAEYEQLALELAQEPARLKKLRDRLCTAAPSSPLFDTATLTRDIEDAYRRVYERYCNREAAALIDI